MNFAQSSSLNRFVPIFAPMSMGTRLQEALDLRQRTAPDVIAACRLSKGAIYNILNDTTKPEKVRAETINKVAGYLNVSRDWLVWGKGSADDVEQVAEEGWADIIGVRQAAALGEGAVVDDYAETHKLKFRAESLRRKKLRADRLAVLYGRGESMAPTIKNGDAILFDTSDIEPRDDKIYVISYEGTLMAKRLVELGGRWFIASDNKDDPKWRKPVAVEETRQFAIHGRVRWIGSWED
ncbi:Phage repressor protein C, contains Cro/C1-type HTH and peptisase s24 domains [Luteibacter sp. UNC138MFCol5.1]|uniref:XRE family transcriptional regulator n=1 Tax=Luteibacter sp. UNC138MFCol5.1 TaxID=1502774 RepID=UPI0008B8E366|nr:XRE family transcriptional regulator [Luteibacter sp. UNC138MFCol5.1]SEO63981.1 Phage repressor protein C, contains Cro/C1-type HTH and peptisase s24 domains [Luteibacter sp. UNC138MFCol5.1]